METIEAAILKVTDTKLVNLSKLRGFGTDSAPVMSGSRNGVVKRLIDTFPKLLRIHCVNHRLALAAAHAADDIPYLIRFKASVQTSFIFYRNSAVHMAGLHAI